MCSLDSENVTVSRKATAVYRTLIWLSLISVALSNDFVMSALLAFSASHLAWQTRNSDTERLVDHHSGAALQGLHDAMETISEGVSEAILATCILLSWQVKEW